MSDPKILSGKDVSIDVYKSLSTRIKLLKDKKIIPSLAVILVGDNPASSVYVRSKAKTFKKLNLFSKTFTLSSDVSSEDLLDLIFKLNQNVKYHGILVQLPLPKHINSQKVIDSINPEKDVDGFHPQNVGLLTIGNPRFIPCTPKGIMRILEYYSISLEGKHVVIVGRSNIVGRPISILCSHKGLNKNATVTICHSGSKDISNYTKVADVVMVALGVPNFLSAEMIKKDAIIIDVGINRVESSTTSKGYELVGDADFKNVINKVSSITPVPGGVGPMTIAMLVENTVESAEAMYKFKTIS
jgi:methylenetetrahydrofolate dehydrogenase (NADP+)/methenyltetrahydrofolate cyclohydrolase